MKLKLVFIMDPIESIHYEKDSTFAIMLEAQHRGWHIYIMTIQDLFLKDGNVMANLQKIQVKDKAPNWFTAVGKKAQKALTDFDLTFMRKDPPFDMAYLYTTHLLDLAQSKGHLVVNAPQALRDMNEKLFTGWFPHLCPSTLVSSQPSLIKDFLKEHKAIILKPLDKMGGQSIFKLTVGDPNTSVIIDMLTENGTLAIMAQVFLKAIHKGDKRILVIDGKPYPFALLRIPQKGEVRANLFAGGTGVGVKLTTLERKLAEEVGQIIHSKGILFAGLDVIGNKLTEINVTSPTCIREIDKAFKVNISAEICDALARRLL